jgi:HK97 family phage portal protein
MMRWWNPFSWGPSPVETGSEPYREEKASVTGPIIAAGYVGQPVWTPRNYAHLSREAYVQNAVAYRCVKLIATAAASAPWLLKGRGGAVIDDHQLLTLLKRPGPMIGGCSLFEAFYSYLMLEGNGYLEGVGPSDTAPPKELWAPRPDRMKVIPGEYGLPQGYRYDANGLIREWKVDPITGVGPILHVKEFHPLNDWYGLARTEPAGYGVDRHNASSAHNKALLDNGARPSGALVFQPVKNTDGSMTTAPQGVIDAAKKALVDGHTGPRNAGKPHVFGGLVDWLEMGINPKDMDFAKGKDDAARDICLSYGVPHILVVPGQSTYNNVREAKLELWEDTVLPLIDKVTDALDAWLCPQFGDGLNLGVDLDEIPALEPRREAKRASIIAMVDKGLLDTDEGREALQYGPRPAGALKMNRGDGPVLVALLQTAQAGVYEPLFLYLKSVGLLDQADTLADFQSAFDSGALNEEDILAAHTPGAIGFKPGPGQENPDNAQP